MFLEAIGKALVGKVTAVAISPIGDFLHAVFANEKAFAYARESLRPKYEDLVRPASYENVVTNLRLVKQDFIDYYKDLDRPPARSLTAYVRARLRERSEGWLFNRPGSEVFDRLLDDFFRAYEAYYLTTDPLFATLRLLETTNEVMAAIQDLRTTLATRSAADLRPALRRGLPDEIITFVTTLNIPFDVLEKADGHVDLLLTDPSSILPARFFLFASQAVSGTATVDAMLDRAGQCGALSQVLLVTEAPPAADVRAYAERRRVTVLSVAELRERLTGVGPDEKYVLGRVASQALLEAFNVHDVYIYPDAVPAYPGDRMEDKYLDVRVPVLNLVHGFLSNPDDKILFVFGGYGSGKSALAARLVHDLPRSDVRPVYVSLRQLKSADDLVRIVQKADQLARLNPSSGPCLVILDGMDELPNAMKANEKRLNILRLLEAATKSDKIIVTVRTSYFRGLDDFWDFFARTEDTPLWERLAKQTPSGKKRPRVTALILREFDNQQIDRYVAAFAEGRGLQADFPAQFFARMGRSDPWQIYRSMARNPLYLFLLVSNEPWDVPGVLCFADVVDVFVRYWLWRDVEKGQSRWQLRTQDRRDFMAAAAWRMFTQSKTFIGFDEFDAAVREFFAHDLEPEECLSLSLDLQTTGIFSCIGGAIYFSLPAFQDFFVAERYHALIASGSGPGQWPPRLPTVNQAHLLLGMVESRQTCMPRGALDAETYLRGIGSDLGQGLADPISLPANGILYGPHPRTNWPTVNAAVNLPLRMILNAALRHRTSSLPSIKLRFTNDLGLHARPSARLARHYRSWKEGLGREPGPTLLLRHNDVEASLASMLDLMLLCVSGPATCEVLYADCSIQEVVEFLKQVGAVPESEGIGMWTADLSSSFA